MPEERAQAQHELERFWSSLGDPSSGAVASVVQVLGKAEPISPATASEWETWWETWARSRPRR